MTPLGTDALRLLFSGVIRQLRIHRSSRQLLPEAGDRLFLDCADIARDPRLQKIGLALLAGTEPGAQQTLLHLLEAGRIPPQRILTVRRMGSLFLALLPVLRHLLAALLRPEQVRPLLIAEAGQYMAEVQQHTQALEVMRTQPIETLVGMYRQGQLPATAQHAIGAFLQAYGMRGTAEIDLGRPRWHDDPTPIMQTLLSYLQLEDPAQAPDVLFRRRVEQAERLGREYVDRARQMRFGWLRAQLLGGLVRRLRALGGLREVPLFYIARVYAVYRAALLGHARKLVAQGALESAEDIFFVPLETLKRFAEGETADSKSIAIANRAEYERECTRQQMPRILLSTGEAFYEGVRDTAASENALVGNAVSSGIVEGQVRVILDPRDTHLEPGDILVCPATDPGWTPLFLTAGGLVMEIGGMMTHGSIVAREYGIPAVVGVHQATTRLQTGQRVRVDGNNGRVEILG